MNAHDEGGERPSRSANRPTTATATVEEAIVISHHRREVEVECIEPGADQGTALRCFLRSATVGVFTGDRVLIQRDPEAADRGVIVSVKPRRNLLSRHKPTGSRPICANLDRLLITIAPDPAPHVDLIDRYLVAAHLDGLQADLVLNKCDIPARSDPDVDALLALYRSLGIRIFETSAVTGHGVAELGASLADCTAALVGQSGVGKSSLINALLPEAEAEVGALSAKRNRGRSRGRHTTTAARLYHLDGALIIDSPGIREFTPEVPDIQALIAGFPEIARAATECRFRNCRHDREPDCGVSAALASGAIDRRRWQSYCQLRDHLPDLR